MIPVIPNTASSLILSGADVTVSNPGKAGQMKRLPISNWNAGNLIKKMPNLRGDNGPCSTASGYYLWEKLQWLGIEQQQFSHVRF